ncbi:MAG: acetyl-CoA carboxylase carboxyltransferase subunit alpha [Bacteroidota bacterium]
MVKADDFFDFERPIFDLEKKLEDLRVRGENKEIGSDEIKEFEKKINDLKVIIYNNLSRWQRVQISRHPARPYSLDYISAISDEFIELFGDRQFSDDKAMIGGLGKIEGNPVVFIGQQKGRTTKERQYRNFGMPNPEGYRKALRLMRMAEKFELPLVIFIDTPGAYPGIEAEERGQGEAIAKNLMEMAILKVPIICIIIGEGASGGALGIGVGDRVHMLENTWYSVISPESCSSILWRTWENKEKAAEALKLTAEDNLSFGIVDGIINEPLGGAHKNSAQTFSHVKNQILEDLGLLQELDTPTLVARRIEKFSQMGVFLEATEDGSSVVTEVIR